MNKPWSSFYPDILPHVPKCPEPIVEHELRRAAQSFFEATRAWKVELEPIPVSAGEVLIQIMADDSQMEIVRVESAWYDGEPIDIFPIESQASFSDWEKDTGTPTEAYMLSPAEVRLYPIPDTAASRGLRCNVSVKPSNISSGIPENLFSKFRETIIRGAKARLMLYIDKPWASPEMAIAYGRLFEADISSAVASAARGFGSSRIVSRVRWC